MTDVMTKAPNGAKLIGSCTIPKMLKLLMPPALTLQCMIETTLVQCKGAAVSPELQGQLTTGLDSMLHSAEVAFYSKTTRMVQVHANEGVGSVHVVR